MFLWTNIKIIYIELKMKKGVDFQCCVSFWCVAKWFSYTYTYIHSLSDSFPIWVITEGWVEFPVLYSKSLLVICFIFSRIFQWTHLYPWYSKSDSWTTGSSITWQLLRNKEPEPQAYWIKYQGNLYTFKCLKSPDL